LCLKHHQEFYNSFLTPEYINDRLSTLGRNKINKKANIGWWYSSIIFIPHFSYFFSACQSHQRTFDHFGGAYCVQFLGQREPFSWWSPGRLKSVFCFLCPKSPYVLPAKTRHRLSPRATLTSFSDGWVYLSWLVILQPAKMLRLWRGQSPWYFGNHDPTIQTRSQQKLEPWGHGKKMLFHLQTLTWMFVIKIAFINRRRRRWILSVGNIAWTPLLLELIGRLGTISWHFYNNFVTLI